MIRLIVAVCKISQNFNPSVCFLTGEIFSNFLFDGFYNSFRIISLGFIVCKNVINSIVSEKFFNLVIFVFTTLIRPEIFWFICGILEQIIHYIYHFPPCQGFHWSCVEESGKYVYENNKMTVTIIMLSIARHVCSVTVPLVVQ